MTEILKVYQGATEVDRIYSGATQTFDKTTKPMHIGGGGGTTPWTPALITTELWLKADAANVTLTGTGNYISQWNDLSGNGRHRVQLTQSFQAEFINAAGGVVTTASTALGAGINSLTSTDIIAVMRHGVDGTAATFSTYNRIFDGTAGGIYAVQGQPYLEAAGITNQSYINGSADGTNILLPMTKSIQRFKYTQITGSQYILRRSDTSRGWYGATWEYIIPAAGTSNDNIARLEGYLAWEHGITLASGHPYKLAAPTV